MKPFKSRNWGLRLLALALAIVIYYALSGTSAQQEGNHEHTIFRHN